jgi:uncharacterized delta-60 repeat protein
MQPRSVLGNRDGSLDGSFEPSLGEPSWVQCLAIQPDGKVLAGGRVKTMDGTAFAGIVRLEADGSLDTSFNPATDPTSYVNAMALQADGKVLVAPGFNALDYPGIARLNADGSYDSGFRPATMPESSVSVIALQSDGKVVIGGRIRMATGIHTAIARLNADGSMDPSFTLATGPNDFVRDVAFQPEGHIVMSGGFSTGTGNSYTALLRLHHNGTLDTNFVSPPLQSLNDSPAVFCLGTQADGRIIIGGHFTWSGGTNRNSIARLNPNGTLDESFDPGTGISALPHSAVARIFAIAVQPDGNVLIGGNFNGVKETSRWMIARLFGDTPVALNNPFPSGASIILNWHTISNRTYRVQYKDHLSAERWVDLPGDVQAQGPTASKVDATAESGRQRFYRVMRLP